MGDIFDDIPDRRGTNSFKWDTETEHLRRDDPIPMWVADMDFPVAAPIREALERITDHGVFGYTFVPESFYEAAMGWYSRRWNLDLQREWLLPVPGVVTGIRIAVEAFSNPGDAVVIQPPVYYPFRAVVRSGKRRVVENPLRRNDDNYRIDLEHLETVLTPDVKLLVLCSPHNPVSRVWRPDELAGLLEICDRYGVIIVSDEIHGDITMPGLTQTSLAKLAPGSGAVTLLSATKSFNLAGLPFSCAAIPDPQLKKRFDDVVKTQFYPIADVYAVKASEAAYRHGDEWLDALLAYIQGNFEYLREVLASELPPVRCAPLEGTYLAWLDFSELEADDDALTKRIEAVAGIRLNPGPMFGTGGAGFQRMNLATSRAVLEKALTRLVSAFRDLS